MNVLLLAREVGPTEGMLYSKLRENEHRVFVYDVNGQWLKPDGPAPFWAKGYRLRQSTLAANYLEAFIEAHDIGHVIASGLEACAFASQTLSVPFTPLLWRGSLDYSASRVGPTEDFRRVMRASDRLLLDDEWEMDKANSKGSLLPHLRIPLPRLTPTPILKRTGTPHIALIHPPQISAERLLAFRKTIMAALPTTEITTVDINSCYRTRDVVRGRILQPTLQWRLGDFTHVALLGSSTHHSGLLMALRYDWDRVVIEDTIGSRHLSQDLGFTQIGRGLNLARLLRDIVQEESSTAIGATSNLIDTPVDDYLTILSELMSRRVSQFHEDLDALRSEEPLNVFFSTAALEDRTNGARPQRIRNMSEAMSDEGPTIRIFSGEAGFERRARLISDLLTAGRQPGVFYGENSTSPIVSKEVVTGLGKLMKSFADAGGRTAWFVRDLHWLDDIEGYLDRDDQRELIREQGLAELEHIASVANVLFAPSVASGYGFNRLLERQGAQAYDWAALPPGVAAANIVDAAEVRALPSEGTTLLYSGGLSAVYAMDLYLKALSILPKSGYWFDFVIREAEVSNLHDSLERFGLADDNRVRISTTPLDTFLPRTRRCIGVILLESEYALLSFPYKTVSMIECGYPILCYQDMGIADFVTKNDVGIACDRSVSSIVSGVEKLAAGREEGIRQARVRESWQQRARLLHTI